MKDEVYKQVLNEVKAAGGVVPEDGDNIGQANQENQEGRMQSGSFNNSNKKASGGVPTPTELKVS